MKICAIGNSHLAAFKLAWNDLAESFPEIELTFFGSAGGVLKESIAVENGCLLATNEKVRKDFLNTSGGLDAARFDDYDLILLTGMHCSIFMLGQALKTHVAFDAPALKKSDSFNSISSSCIIQTCKDQMATTSLFHILSLMRTVSDTPVVVVPTPFPSEACILDENLAQYRFLAMNACQTVQDCYYQGIIELCSTYKASVICQPEHTVANYLFTKDHLSRGSVRLSSDLSTPHEETDYGHMNKQYGIEVLNHVLPQCFNASHEPA